MLEELTMLLALLKPHVIDFILVFFVCKFQCYIPLGYVDKCGFPPPGGVSGGNELSIQKECSQFPISDSLQHLVYFA